MIKNVNLTELLGSRSRDAIQNRRMAQSPDVFTRVVGFHIYGDLRLNLPLAAASDQQNATKYLNILEHYAALADVSAREAGAHLLEVQGERVHLVLPAEVVDETAMRSLMRFCISLTQFVFAELKPLAGDHWDGFALAADHGPAVIIATGQEGDDSVISFGNCANTPAKRLAREPVVASGSLALPLALAERSATLQPALDHRKAWIEINVKEPIQALVWLADPQLTHAMKAAHEFALANERPISNRVVSFASAETFAKGVGQSAPITVQGLYLRADLDGFTRQVEAAFKAGEAAIRALVERFIIIMTFPDLFARKLNRPTIALPFAGDCANRILLLKPNENYETVQKFLPPIAALAWHDGDGAEEERIKTVRRALETAPWSIGVAGGGTESSSGHMLVATIGTSKRDFRIAAGWGARRSLDAQQASGVGSDDTVVHVDDYKTLDPSYRDAFNALPGSTIFRRATLEGLKKARVDKIKTEAKPTRIEVPFASTAPAIISRPHSY